MPEVIGWVSLLRGVQTLLSAAWEWITRGSVKLILYPYAMDIQLATQTNPEVTAKLMALSQLWESSRGTLNDTEEASLRDASSATRGPWLDLVFNRPMPGGRHVDCDGMADPSARGLCFDGC